MLIEGIKPSVIKTSSDITTGIFKCYYSFVFDSAVESAVGSTVGLMVGLAVESIVGSAVGSALESMVGSAVASIITFNNDAKPGIIWYIIYIEILWLSMVRPIIIQWFDQQLNQQLDQ